MRRGLTAAATVGFVAFGAGGALAVPSQAHPAEMTASIQCRLFPLGATTYRATLPKGNVGCGAATEALTGRLSGEGLLQGRRGGLAAERYAWTCGYASGGAGCMRRGRKSVTASGDIVGEVIGRAHIATPTRQLPQITGQAAHRYSVVALRRRFGGMFYLGGSRIICNKRISRTRIRCSVSWYQGDFLFGGRSDIWYSWSGAQVAWNYAYDITRVDDYCHSVQHRPLAKCSRHYHVS
jgi:hypothetical protein